MLTLAEKSCTDKVCALVLVSGAVTTAKEEPTEKFLWRCLSERYMGTGYIFPVLTNIILYVRTANLNMWRQLSTSTESFLFPFLSPLQVKKWISALSKYFGGGGGINLISFHIEEQNKFQFKIKKTSSWWIQQTVGVSWACDYLILFRQLTVNGTNGIPWHLI